MEDVEEFEDIEELVLLVAISSGMENQNLTRSLNIFQKKVQKWPNFVIFVKSSGMRQTSLCPYAGLD